MSDTVNPSCGCAPSPSNPHALAVRKSDGLPEFCTTADPCLDCRDKDGVSRGCSACGNRGYTQHCERK